MSRVRASSLLLAPGGTGHCDVPRKKGSFSAEVGFV